MMSTDQPPVDDDDDLQQLAAASTEATQSPLLLRCMAAKCTQSPAKHGVMRLHYIEQHADLRKKNQSNRGQVLPQVIPPSEACEKCISFGTPKSLLDRGIISAHFCKRHLMSTAHGYDGQRYFCTLDRLSFVQEIHAQRHAKRHLMANKTTANANRIIGYEDPDPSRDSPLDEQVSAMLRLGKLKLSKRGAYPSGSGSAELLPNDVLSPVPPSGSASSEVGVDDHSSQVGAIEESSPPPIRRSKRLRRALVENDPDANETFDVDAQTHAAHSSQCVEQVEPQNIAEKAYDEEHKMTEYTEAFAFEVNHPDPESSESLVGVLEFDLDDDDMNEPIELEAPRSDEPACLDNYGYKLSSAALDKLATPHTLVNDSIIGYYIGMLQEHHRARTAVSDADHIHMRKVLFFDPTFYQFLRGRNGMKRALRNNNRAPHSANPPVNYFDFDQLIIPILWEGHWTVMDVWPIRKKMYYYDSLASRARSMQHRLSITHLLAVESGAFEQGPINWEEWTFDDMACAQQPNFIDCGVYVCLNLRLIYDGRYVPFYSTDDIAGYRQRIKRELLTGQLIPLT